MADKKVNLIISLKDGVSSALQKIRGGLSSVGNAFKTVAKAGAIAFAGLGVAAGALAFTIKKAFDFETAKVQLKSLLGSVQLASKRFDELKKFSAETPFQLPDILKASRTLTVFSEGALGSADSLRAIGDAAAVAGVPISEVSFWVGRAYSMLKGGQPFGEAAMRLQEMGILTSKTRQEMERMQAGGASFSQVWKVLNGDLGRFKGGMKDLSSTGNGLISTLKDNWTIAVAKFGDAFMELSKGALTDAINTIKKLTEDGTITKWAEQAKEGLQAVIDTVKILSTGSGEARTAVMGAIGGVIVAAFKDAGNIIVEIIKRAAPTIGELIAKGIAGIGMAAVRPAGDRAVAEQRLSDGSQFERSLPFTPAARRNEEKIQAEIQKIVNERTLSLDADFEASLKGVAKHSSFAMSELEKTLSEFGTKIPESTKTASGYVYSSAQTASTEIKDSGEKIAESVTGLVDGVADSAKAAVKKSQGFGAVFEFGGEGGLLERLKAEQSIFKMRKEETSSLASSGARPLLSLSEGFLGSGKSREGYFGDKLSQINSNLSALSTAINVESGAVSSKQLEMLGEKQLAFLKTISENVGGVR